MGKRLLLFALGLLFGVALHAQFMLPGDEPANIQWSEIHSKNFSVIYPRGKDSLAQEYGRSLERFRAYEALSVGYLPSVGGRTPVLLHSLTATSNGSVTWAPKRMELYTLPSLDAPEATPWITQLAVHESRHLAQMQLGYSGPIRWGSYLFGDMWNGLLSGLYPRIMLLEGDAVVAETALTQSGRGRTADFMDYYKMAFDNGDFRSYDAWRYGSFYKYTPSHYPLGYMLVGGARALYDAPSITGDFFYRAERKLFTSFPKTVSKVAGKRFKEAFRDIEQYFADNWAAEDSLRAPFMETESLSVPGRFEKVYSSAVLAGDNYWCLVESNDSERRIVSVFIKDGSVIDYGPFSYLSSTLSYDPVENRLYWSEVIPDRRWEMKEYSIVRYLDLDAPFKLRNFEPVGRDSRLFNPTPSDDGRYLVMISVPEDASPKVAIANVKTQRIFCHLAAPQNVQFTEALWHGEYVYALGITPEGFGMWRHRISAIPYLDSEPSAEIVGDWELCIEPSVKKMNTLRLTDGRLTYTSDQNGSNELYHYIPESGRLFRLSNLKYGGRFFGLKGDSLCFISPSPLGGYLPMRAKLDVAVEAAVNEVHEYAIADILSRQEAQLQQSAEGFIERNAPQEFSEPKKYSRLSHLVNVHSWLPGFYADMDDVSIASSEDVLTSTRLGTTVMFQNILGSFSGSAGLSVNSSEYCDNLCVGMHLTARYTGLPVKFKMGIDVNERPSLLHYLEADEESMSVYSASQSRGKPLTNFDLQAYYPMSWSSGGIYSGFIPQVYYSYTNDRFDPGFVMHISPGVTMSHDHRIQGNERGAEMSSLRVAARGYSMMSTPSSRIYPRWGFSLEGGVAGAMRLYDIFSPNAYAYSYAYLPGLLPASGFMLSMTYQQHLGKSLFSNSAVTTVPTGYDSSVNSLMGTYFNSHIKLGLRWAIPVNIGEHTLLSTYLTTGNLIFTPFAEISSFSNGSVVPSGELLSAGSSLVIRLRNVMWDFNGRLGFRAGWKGGSLCEDMNVKGGFFIEPVISFDM